MNSRRINDAYDETQLTHETRRSSSDNYNNLINGDDNDIDTDDDDSDHDDIHPGTFSLNKVLDRFGNNIELLELILTSKVEEDRRLTEEAKLKIKQLDYQKDKKRKENTSNRSYFPSTRLPRLQDHHQFSTSTLISPSENDSTPIRRSPVFSQNHHYTPDHHHHSDPSDNNQQNPKNSHPSLSMHSRITTRLPFITTPPDSNTIKKPTHFFTAPSLSATQPSSSSPSPSTPIPSLTYATNNNHQSFPFSSTTNSSRDFSNPLDTITTTTPLPPSLPQHHPPPHSSTIINNKLPIPQISQNHHHHQHRQERDSPSPSSRQQQQLFKRRRREMQSITMIIETKEFPYIDNYNWKNNGNTVHKKSGQRSIYYKCSNAAKGCHVNKTVTCKGQGEYLIKYRGKHLATCPTSNNNPPSTSPVSLEPSLAS